MKECGRGSIDTLVVHRINTKFTFLVAIANIDVARSCRKKKPLFYNNVIVRQGVAERAARKTDRFVCLIKDTDIKWWQPARTLPDNR